MGSYQDLRRQILTVQGVNATTDQTSPPNRDRNRGLKYSEGGYSHTVYLKAILDKWNGQLEELFELKNWKKWIRSVAKSRGDGDKFLNTKGLEGFASGLMQLIFDENQPHLDKIQRNFNSDQKDRFQLLKKEYDEKDHLDLLKLCNSQNLDANDDDSRNPWDVSDDDSAPDMEPLLNGGGEQVRFKVSNRPSSSCDDENSGDEKGGLFQDLWSDLSDLSRPFLTQS